MCPSIISVSFDYLHLMAPSNLSTTWFYEIVDISDEWGYGLFDTVEEGFEQLIVDFKLDLSDLPAYNLVLEDWYRYLMRYHYFGSLVGDQEVRNLIISKIEGLLDKFEDEMPLEVAEHQLAEKGRLHFLFPHNCEIKLSSSPQGARIFFLKENEDEEYFVGRTPITSWIDWKYGCFEGSRTYQFRLLWDDNVEYTGGFKLPSSGVLDLGTVTKPT